MSKLYIAIFSTFLLSNPIWAYSAGQVTETNSLSKAALEMQSANYRGTQTDVIIKSSTRPYSHESQKNNSLSSAVLARQGVKVNLLIGSDSKVTYSRHSNTSEKNNSLAHGALAK